MESCTESFIQSQVIPRLAPSNEHWHVESCSEQVLDRLLGGSGDSCVVARLICTVQVQKKDVVLSEPHDIDHGSDHANPKQLSKRRRTRSRSNDKLNSSSEKKVERRTVRFIVKRVVGPSSRYAELDSLKTEIKRLSYKIEGNFLETISSSLSWLNNSVSRSIYWCDDSAFTSLLIEEDLVEKGFPIHVGELNRRQSFVAIEWLARFHANFQQSQAPKLDESARTCCIWARGGYWSLDKRTEEYRKIRHRYKESLIELDEEEEAFRDLPSNFALRLERSAHALDALFYPESPPIPFSHEDERRAYSTQDVQENESDGRDGIRKSFVRRVGEQCLSLFPPKSIPSKRKHDRKRTKHPLATSTVIHGDFKAENIFFSNNISSCTVCDFQWIGYGLGVLDIVTLVCGSLLPEAETFKFIERLLDRYYDVYTDTMNLTTSRWYRDRGRSLLGHLFDWALVDYSRFVVGSGVMFPEDVFFLRRAERILCRVDGGVPHCDSEAYSRAIHELMDRTLYI